MTSETIAKLPTLMDIVNHYLKGEREIENRIKNSRFNGLFPTQAQKGYYEPIHMPDGLYSLFPLSPAQHSYYRGESVYHTDCYPSLYRKSMSEADVFVERIKRCEMEHMMQEYPITDLFANSIHAKAPDGIWHQLRFHIGYDGMAQHYGIKTEFMDMTLDPMIAAFFAATTYDSNTDSYSAITDTDKYPYGVFYLYNQVPFGDIRKSRIDVVGMQPLLRPERQLAYVFKLNPNENFNLFMQKTLFRHDAGINKEIVERVNQDSCLFPKEIIGERIRNEIVMGNVFSEWAYNEAKHRYAKDKSESDLKKLLDSKKVIISHSDRQWFTEGEKNDALDYWKTYQQELFSKLRLRWMYHGPIIHNS